MFFISRDRHSLLVYLFLFSVGSMLSAETKVSWETRQKASYWLFSNLSYSKSSDSKKRGRTKQAQQEAGGNYVAKLLFCLFTLVFF